MLIKALLASRLKEPLELFLGVFLWAFALWHVLFISRATDAIAYPLQVLLKQIDDVITIKNFSICLQFSLLVPYLLFVEVVFLRRQVAALE